MILPDEERAISPVMGTVLMLGIVVILGTVVATMAFGLDDRLRDPVLDEPFEKDYVPSGEGNTDNRPYVVLTHQAGEPVDSESIFIRDESGNTIKWSDVWNTGPKVGAGETVHIDGKGSDNALNAPCEEGQSYYVTVEQSGGQEIVNEWTVPEEPSVPPGVGVDGNGDGLPDYC